MKAKELVESLMNNFLPDDEIELVSDVRQFDCEQADYLVLTPELVLARIKTNIGETNEKN